jgi:hypothetical protein
VTITVTPVFGRDDFDPVVYVQDHDDCGDPAHAIACIGAADVAGPGLTETLVIPPDAAQRVFHVYVDTKSPAAAGSDYTITIEGI